MADDKRCMTLDECTHTVERLSTDLQEVVDYFRFGDDQDALPALAKLIPAQLGLDEVARRLRKRKRDREREQRQLQLGDSEDKSDSQRSAGHHREAYGASSTARSKAASSLAQIPAESSPPQKRAPKSSSTPVRVPDEEGTAGYASSSSVAIPRSDDTPVLAKIPFITARRVDDESRAQPRAKPRISSVVQISPPRETPATSSGASSSRGSKGQRRKKGAKILPEITLPQSGARDGGREDTESKRKRLQGRTTTIDEKNLQHKSVLRDRTTGRYASSTNPNAMQYIDVRQVSQDTHLHYIRKAKILAKEKPQPNSEAMLRSSDDESDPRADNDGESQRSEELIDANDPLTTDCPQLSKVPSVETPDETVTTPEGQDSEESVHRTPDTPVVTPITPTEFCAFRFPSPVPYPEEDTSYGDYGPGPTDKTATTESITGTPGESQLSTTAGAEEPSVSQEIIMDPSEPILVKTEVLDAQEESLHKLSPTSRRRKCREIRSSLRLRVTDNPLSVVVIDSEEEYELATDGTRIKREPEDVMAQGLTQRASQLSKETMLQMVKDLQRLAQQMPDDTTATTTAEATSPSLDETTIQPE